MLASSKESAARSAVIAGLLDTGNSVAAAVLADSSVLLADALKTGLEFIAMLLAWLSIRRIRRGGGLSYEYGIGKLENLASLLIGALMLIVVLVIVASAVRNLIHPEHVHGVGLYLGLAGQVVFGSVNAWLWIKSGRAARAENSPIMASQARLFLTRLVGNLLILTAVGSAMLLAGVAWSVYIDPLAALLIGASIIISAAGVFSSSVYDLLDGTIAEEDKLKIMRCLAENFERYDMIYGVRCRRAGNRSFVDIFLGFAPDKRVAEVERDIDVIRRGVESSLQGCSVTVVLGQSGSSVAGPEPV